jgi:sigma-E factor negative regulatory protein RseA
MSNEELESQLSAMFDNELPEAQCELLARRLARDEALKARWGRYAAIGAAIRSEGAVRLHSGFANRVSLAVAAEPALLSASAGKTVRRLANRGIRAWWQPAAGAAAASVVAAAAILWLRGESPNGELTIVSPAGPLQAQIAPVVNPRPAPTADSYVVPTAVDQHPLLVPPADLANYVVAHSEFSTPLLRRNLLSAFVAAESAAAASATPAPSKDKDEHRTRDADQAR